MTAAWPREDLQDRQRLTKLVSSLLLAGPMKAQRIARTVKLRAPKALFDSRARFKPACELCLELLGEAAASCKPHLGALSGCSEACAL